MKTYSKKAASILLCIVLVGTMLLPGLTSFSADITLEITQDNTPVTERLEVQEDRTIQLGYTLSTDAPDGSYVVWESSQPLLASVDSSGTVRGLDYSKAIIIQQWLDTEVRSTPVVGETMANAIENALTSSGIDLETANTDLIVGIVSGISPELGESLRKVLDNMNVEITATLYDAEGNALASDKIEVIVTQSLLGTIAPTGVFITNKNAVPTTVAVGATVQLYGAVTPVRLQQGIRWSMGSSALDRNSANYATVSADGLVTFTAPGTATVRVNPQNVLYAAFSDTVTFTIVDPSELPVTNFDITGETTVSEGATTQLSIDNLDPPGAYTGDLKWESDDPSIATVDQHGVVTGLDGGSGLTYSRTVTIRAIIGEVTRTTTVTVTRSLLGATISGVEINGPTAVGIDNTAQYTANISPARLDSNRDVVRTWGIMDPVSGEKRSASQDLEASTDIAKIDNSGLLTGLSSGTATIFVDATYNGTTVTGEYTVLIGNAITDFTITGTASITEGNTTQLSISNITPGDYDPALLNTVVWKVEDPGIASVDQNGLVKGLDAGGRLNSNTRSTVVTATIGGVSRTFTVTVRGPGLFATNQYTGGHIIGPDAVVVDFPYTYSAIHTPERMDVGRQYWGVVTDDGSAPWSSSNNYRGGGNTDNSYASVDESAGLVTGKQAGKTTLWTFMSNSNLVPTSHQDIQKEIEVVELTPKSITITAPEKYDYLEGESELDLTGLVVKLTYDRDELAQYYPEAAEYSEDQLTVEVTDYTVSAINTSNLDSEQYIVVTVTRAGKDMRGIFPILVHSKQVDTIEVIENPKYQYLEGETELDTTGLRIRANYLNAESEEVTDFVVTTSDFDSALYNVEQNIRVTYSHAGRSATTTFPVIVYGIPVVSVSVGNEYEGNWTKDDVTFTLDATNQVDGITYYYKTDSDPEWKAIPGNTLTVDTDIEETYYFKAANGIGIESAETIGYQVRIDKVTPVFTLVPDTNDLTNQSYNVTVNVGEIGRSGVSSIMQGESDITEQGQFVVDKNGTYTVKVTSVSGLESEQTIEITNIDKDAPTVTGIDLAQKNIGGFARFLNSLTFGLFFKETVVITISAEDTGVAGIDRIEYRFLDETGNPIGDWEVYDESHKPEQDPDFKGYVEARAFDKATNESESISSKGYVIDGTAPTDIEIQAKDADGVYIDGTWTSTDVTLKLSSKAFSDIYKYYYKTDGDWVEMDGDTLTVSSHGVTDYQFKAVSYSDLESEIAAFTVKIDKITPVIRVKFAGTFGRWTSGDVHFDFSLLENAISGITYYYSTNGEDWIPVTTGDALVLHENTNATYVFKAVNGAGVESTPSDSYPVMIDSVAPTVTFTPAVTSETTEPYDVAFQIKTGEAGLRSVSVNGVDMTGQDHLTVSKSGEYVFVITGENGLVTTEVLTIENIVDEFSIEVSAISMLGQTSGSFANYLNEPFGKFFKEPVEITVSVACSGCKLGNIQYRLLNAGAEPTTDWLPYNSGEKPIIAPNFKGYVEARAFDASNKHVSEIMRSEGITVDATAPAAPVVMATVGDSDYTGDWTGEPITVTLSSEAFSGIWKYSYSVNGGEFTDLPGNTITLTDVGENMYTFKAVSKATLESVTSTLKAKVDSVQPALAVAVDGMIGHRTSDDVQFTLTSPNTPSGITYYYNTGSEWVALDGNTLTVSENGDAQYAFKAVNGAGVESHPSPYYHVILDKNYLLVEKKPILNVSVSGKTDAYTALPVQFILSAAECEGDVLYYYDNGAGWQLMESNTLAVTASGTGVYKFKAVDSTGRESLESAAYTVMIDTVMPTVTVELDSTDFTSSARTATVNATSGVSGIQSITVNGEDITEASAFTVTENGTYTVTVTANNGLSATTTLMVSSFDYEAPTVTDISMAHKNTGGFARFLNKLTFGLFFNEVTEITVTAGDEGASGLDRIEYRLLDENGAVTADWAVYDESDKPTVDNAFCGYVEARAYDKAGNESAVISSQGFTVDTEAPKNIAVAATVDGEPYDGAYTSKDVILTPSAEAFSDIYAYQYKIDDGTWNTMTTESITAIEGVHAYTFRAVSNADLTSDTVSVITKVEKGTPELSVTVTGTTGAWTADDVVVTLNGTHGQSGLTYYYDNGSGWVEMDSNVLVINDNVEAEYRFKVVNGAGVESEASDPVTIMVDKTVPQIEVTGNSDTFTNQDVTLKTAIPDTGLCGIESVTVNGEPLEGDTYTAVQNGTYTFEVKLHNGNVSSVTVTVSNIDKEVPAVDSVTAGNPASTVDGVQIFQTEAEVTIAAADRGVSGVAKIEYRAVNTENLLAKLGISGLWQDYDENDKPVLPEGFSGYVEVRVTDGAGNVSEIFKSDTYLVDTQIPTITADTPYQGEWTAENVEITLDGTAASGIAYFMYKMDSGEWSKLDGSTFTVDAEGEHTYAFKAVSNASLMSDPIYITTRIETAAPQAEVSVFGTTGEWTINAVSFVLKAESVQSGVTYYYDNGNGWTKIEGDTLTVTENGSATYLFKAVNGAGVESVCEGSYLVMKDSEQPTVTVETPEHTPNNALTATVNATSGVSGIQSITVNGEDITEASAFTVTENGTYTVTVTANNGLSATTTLMVSSFDYEAPTVTDISMAHKNTGGFARFLNKLTFGLFFNEVTEITVTAGDEGASGLDRIEYRLLDENGAVTADWAVYDESDKPTVDNAFCGYVEARAYDKAGNESAVISSQGFTVDTEAPKNIAVAATVDGEPYDGAYTSKDVILTPSAEAFSDIYAYQYKIDDGTWNTMTTESITAIEGVHAYTFRAVSNADLTSDTVSVITKVEKGTPELSVTVTGTTGAWTADDVVVTLNGTHGQSGLTYYYDNGSGWVEMDSNVLVINDNVEAEYRFKVVNGAGVESEVSDPVTIMVDKTVPADFTITAVSNGKEVVNGSVSTESVTLTISAKQRNAGVLNYQYKLNNGEWTDMDGDSITVEDDGFYAYSFRAVSQAGVYSDIEQVAFMIDHAKASKGDSDNDGNRITDVSIPKTGSVAAVSILPVGLLITGLALAKKARKDEESEG